MKALREQAMVRRDGHDIGLEKSLLDDDAIRPFYERDEDRRTAELATPVTQV
jgi:hypothetical protein